MKGASRGQVSASLKLVDPIASSDNPPYGTASQKTALSLHEDTGLLVRPLLQIVAIQPWLVERQAHAGACRDDATRLAGPIVRRRDFRRVEDQSARVAV